MKLFYEYIDICNVNLMYIRNIWLIVNIWFVNNLIFLVYVVD